jgi:hypothetical protein
MTKKNKNFAEFAEFMDTVRLMPVVESPEKIRQQFADALREGKRVLKVAYAATHSGIFTGKRSFYLPTEMSAGTHTFTSPFPKPVLSNHDDHRDPLGRVEKAEYVDTSEYFRSTYPALASILHPNTPRKKKIEIARQIVAEIDGKDRDPNYKGLGFIRLQVAITDEGAIEKFLDGRYLTPSTYFVPTKEVLCSICGKDKKGADPCEHDRGDIEDGIPFFAVPFGFEYQEVSNVNLPADPLAIAESMDLRESIPDAHSTITRKDNSQVTFHIFKDSLVSENVTEEEKNVRVKLEDFLLPLQKGEKKLEEMGLETGKLCLGPHDTFPADTVEMANKSLEFLDKFEDSPLKDTIRTGLQGVVEALSPPPEPPSPASTSEDNCPSQEDNPPQEANPFASLAEDPDNLSAEAINALIDHLAGQLPGDDEEYRGDPKLDDPDCPDCWDASDSQDAAKGGSNAGKYKTKGPFCGPSGGAPKGSFPVNTRKRAVAALAYARNAPNPAGIKKCVCRHWGDLPACKKKGDSQDPPVEVKAKVAFVDLLVHLKEASGEDFSDKVEAVGQLLDLATEIGGKASFHVQVAKPGETVSCTECPQKDLMISTLTTQLGAQKEIVKEMIRTMDRAPKQAAEKHPDTPQVDSLIKVEDPTLTGLLPGNSKDDNIIEDGNGRKTIDPKEVYRAIFEKWRDLKVTDGLVEAQRYLVQLKRTGVLPADVTFD